MKQHILILLLLVIGIPLFSQNLEKTKVYTLDECIKTAINANPDLQLNIANLSTANSEIKAATGAYLPSANFSMGYNKKYGGDYVNYNGQIIKTSETNSSTGTYDMNASLNWVLFNGFSRDANYTASKHNLESRNFNIDHNRKKLAYDVTTQYIDVIKKAQIVKAKKEDYELGNQELDKIKANYEAGTAHIGQVYNQESTLGTLELDIVTAENDFNNAKIMLMQTIGIEPNYNFDINESEIPNTVSPEQIANFKQTIGNYNSAVEIALKNRNDVISSDYSIKSAESNITSAQSGYYPTVSASGGWNWSNYSLNNFSTLGYSYLGLSLSMPIFDNFNTNNKIQSAKVALMQAETNKIDLELSIKTAIQTALLNLQSAEKQIDISLKALKASERNYETTKERFREGASSITEYNEANNQLITAQINRISAVYNYYQVQKQVLFAIGK